MKKLRENLHCPNCNKYHIIEWKEEKLKDNFWRNIFYKYYKGRIISSDKIREWTYFERKPRFYLYK